MQQLDMKVYGDYMYIAEDEGIALFVSFIKKNNVLGSFVYNYKIEQARKPLSDYISERCTSRNRYMGLINMAFEWANTAEGVEFWSRLSDEWCNTVLNTHTSRSVKKAVFDSIW